MQLMGHSAQPLRTSRALNWCFERTVPSVTGSCSREWGSHTGDAPRAPGQSISRSLKWSAKNRRAR